MIDPNSNIRFNSR